MMKKQAKNDKPQDPEIKNTVLMFTVFLQSWRSHSSIILISESTLLD